MMNYIIVVSQTIARTSTTNTNQKIQTTTLFPCRETIVICFVVRYALTYRKHIPDQRSMIYVYIYHCMNCVVAFGFAVDATDAQDFGISYPFPQRYPKIRQTTRRRKMNVYRSVYHRTSYIFRTMWIYYHCTSICGVYMKFCMMSSGYGMICYRYFTRFVGYRMIGIFTQG